MLQLGLDTLLWPGKWPTAFSLSEAVNVPKTDFWNLEVMIFGPQKGHEYQIHEYQNPQSVYCGWEIGELLLYKICLKLLQFKFGDLIKNNSNWEKMILKYIAFNFFIILDVWKAKNYNLAVNLACLSHPFNYLL